MQRRYVKAGEYIRARVSFSKKHMIGSLYGIMSPKIITYQEMTDKRKLSFIYWLNKEDKGKTKVQIRIIVLLTSLSVI